MKITKAGHRKRIHQRIRKKLKGSMSRPRLAVYRSNKSIYCQLIDDLKGHTLISASSSDSSIPSNITKIEQAKLVGKLLAEKAANENFDLVVFDRGGYLYHGRVKALADGAREGGLKF